eukprot:2925173-Prymnesium_polylepis.1
MAASDLQVAATRGHVPPDVVPTVGEDSISAAQGASRRSSDALAEIYSSPGSGEHITTTKRLAIRRFTASVPVGVARCSTAGPSPRSSAA